MKGQIEPEKDARVDPRQRRNRRANHQADMLRAPAFRRGIRFLQSRSAFGRALGEVGVHFGERSAPWIRRFTTESDGHNPPAILEPQSETSSAPAIQEDGAPSCYGLLFGHRTAKGVSVSLAPRSSPG
jgi:hypothetical protein